MIKLLHTADVHLGKQFSSLGNRAGEYRAQLLQTFERIIDLAESEKVSLLLIAGDLFDTNRVYGLTIGRVLAALRRLDESGIKVAILPGTHDPFTPDSLYSSTKFPSNVVIFTPQKTEHTYKDLGLTLHGRALDAQSWGESPLKGLQISKESTFNVGMAHCAVKIPGVVEKDVMLLDQEEIAGSGLDYLAMGHWHSMQDFSRGKTVACYCGSPEPLAIDQKGAGNVLLVTLSEGRRVEYSPLRVGAKKCESLPLDISPYNSLEPIARLIDAKADVNLILEVVLTGTCGMDCILKPEELETALADRFFHLRVIDKTHPRLEDVKAEKFPDKTVMSRFLAIAGEKIAAAQTEEEKAVCEEALKLGFALLQGHSMEI